MQNNLLLSFFEKSTVFMSKLLNMKYSKLSLFSTLVMIMCITSLVPIISYAEMYIYENQTGGKLYSDRKLNQEGYRLIEHRAPSIRQFSKKGAMLITDRHGNPVQTAYRKGQYALNNRNKFDRVIQTAAQSFALDPALIKAVIHAESAFNPQAVSKVGALGLMQLMPKTAGMYAVKDPYNPKQNIMAGSQHLKYLMNKYNNRIELALAAYNAGEGNVKKYNGIPPYPETQNYIKKVKKLTKNYARLASL